MSRQHPWPHVTGNRILILILVSETLDHCQNLLDDPRMQELLWFLHRACHVMSIYIYIKFRKDPKFERFLIIERIQMKHELLTDKKPRRIK